MSFSKACSTNVCMSGVGIYCCLTLYLGGFYPSPDCVRKWHLSSESSFSFSVLFGHLCLLVLSKRESIRLYYLPWLPEGRACSGQGAFTSVSRRRGAGAARAAAGAAHAAVRAARAPGQRPARRSHRPRLPRPGAQLPQGPPDPQPLPGEHPLLQVER